MSRSQRAALRLSLALLLVCASMLGLTLTRGPWSAPSASACCTGTFYGATTTRTLNSLTPPGYSAIWPEWNSHTSQTSPTCNCAVVTAEAITNYTDQQAGYSYRFTTQSMQNTVDSVNQSTGVQSQWGYVLQPSNSQPSPCGGYANISGDTGTDPRAAAYMEYAYTPPNFYFHDYVYRWDLFHASEPSYVQQAQEATTMLAEGLQTWGEPVSTVINGGKHTVMVTGVWSDTDPSTHWPAAVNGVVYRDPEYSPSTSRFQVDFGSQWASNGLNSTYSLWSLYYGDNASRGDQLNTGDPEPGVGPYAPSPANGYHHHWYHGFTWIQRDGWTTSPDYAYVAGYRESPSGPFHSSYQMTSP